MNVTEYERPERLESHEFDLVFIETKVPKPRRSQMKRWRKLEAQGGPIPMPTRDVVTGEALIRYWPKPTVDAERGYPIHFTREQLAHLEDQRRRRGKQLGTREAARLWLRNIRLQVARSKAEWNRINAQ